MHGNEHVIYKSFSYRLCIWQVSIANTSYLSMMFSISSSVNISWPKKKLKSCNFLAVFAYIMSHKLLVTDFSRQYLNFFYLSKTMTDYLKNVTEIL